MESPKSRTATIVAVAITVAATSIAVGSVVGAGQQARLGFSVPSEVSNLQLGSYAWAFAGTGTVSVVIAILAGFCSLILLVLKPAGLGKLAPEEEEETATEMSSDMVKAFEERTNLINRMFEEIPKADPDQLNKAYFGELRGKLDTFRIKALQRLNEMTQKSTTQKFFDLLGQIHETDKEVDRAAKDMLNLYEQYYTRRMRQEVFERLLPSYKKRLEKALDRLSDELNTDRRKVQPAARSSVALPTLEEVSTVPAEKAEQGPTKPSSSGVVSGPQRFKPGQLVFHKERVWKIASGRLTEGRWFYDLE